MKGMGRVSRANPTRHIELHTFLAVVLLSPQRSRQLYTYEESSPRRLDPMYGKVEITELWWSGRPRLESRYWGSRKLVCEVAQHTPILAAITASTAGLEIIRRIGIFLSLGRNLELIVSSRNISLSRSDVSRDLEGSS